MHVPGKDGFHNTASGPFRLDYAPFLAVAFADVLNIDSTRRVVFFSQKMAAWDGDPKKPALRETKRSAPDTRAESGVVCQVSLCPKHP